MTGIVPLGSARLRFRKYQEGDAEALFPTMSDDAAMRWWSRAPLTSLEETREYLERGAASGGWRGFYFTREGEDRALGWVSVGEERHGGVCEIGYLLARDAWGQGYAREAAARLIDHLFAEEGIRRIFADTDPENRASIRLLEALSFTLEGRLRGEWETHIGVRDSLIWGLLKDEWRR